jgi:hypothetical protein
MKNLFVYEQIFAQVKILQRLSVIFVTFLLGLKA